MKFAVLNSNEMNKDVMPLFGITFNTEEMREFNLNLEGSRFPDRYETVKIFDCENMI